jgi:hypothetical protein
VKNNWSHFEIHLYLWVGNLWTLFETWFCLQVIYAGKEILGDNSHDMMKNRLMCIEFGDKNVCKSLQTDFLKSSKIYHFLGFKISDKSKLLCVSERISYRQMNTFHLSIYKFTEIDDKTLHFIVTSVLFLPRGGCNKSPRTFNQWCYICDLWRSFSTTLLLCIHFRWYF